MRPEFLPSSAGFEDWENPKSRYLTLLVVLVNWCFERKSKIVSRISDKNPSLRHLTGFPKTMKQVGLDNRNDLSASSSSKMSVNDWACFSSCKAMCFLRLEGKKEFVLKYSTYLCVKLQGSELQGKWICKKKAYIRRKSIYRTPIIHSSNERKSTYEKQRTVATTPDHQLLMTSS